MSLFNWRRTDQAVDPSTALLEGFEVPLRGNTPPVQRFAANIDGRDFAVGDIHGAFGALQIALDTIGFDAGTDRLFSVGDLVDRGPDSPAVMEWLDQPWFHAICGNHDLLAWRRALGDPFAEVDHRQHGGDWLGDLSPADKLALGERLRNLPMAFEVETPAGLVGLVHADLPSDDWQDIHGIDWSELARIESPAGTCIWSFERYDARNTRVVRNVRAVVHGHKTLDRMLVLANVHLIDTGGWDEVGRFTLLDLQTLQAHEGPGVRWYRASGRDHR